MKKKELPRSNLFAFGLNSDGSEIVDTTTVNIGLRGPIKSAEMKLKEMLERELEKQNRPNETELDSYDFELEDESPNTMLHKSVEINPMSANEIRREYREQQIRKKQKQSTVDEIPVDRKSAKTDHAERVATSKNSARANATEGAESEEEG